MAVVNIYTFDKKVLKMAKNSTVLCLIGPDGCGKSSQALRLVDYLRGNGLRVRYVWLRFFHCFSSPLLLIAKILGKTETLYFEDGTKIGVHNFSNMKRFSKLYIYTTCLDTAIAILIKIKIPQFVTGDVIICDRFSYDTLVDLMVTTSDNRLFKEKVGLFFHKKVPKNAKVLMLIGDKSIIATRRPDILHDSNYDLRVTLYKEISKYFEIEIIQTDLSENEVFSKIVSGFGAYESHV
jgi:thymidylate kinase